MSDSTNKPAAAALPGGSLLQEGDRRLPVPGHLEISRDPDRARSPLEQAAERSTSGRLRTVIELSVCLTILVSLFRTFLAGGYMIETGSMAPCLLGYHRQATCPGCRYPFAVEG